jgi:hypothetical protein
MASGPSGKKKNLFLLSPFFGKKIKRFGEKEKMPIKG